MAALWLSGAPRNLELSALSGQKANDDDEPLVLLTKESLYHSSSLGAAQPPAALARTLPDEPVLLNKDSLFFETGYVDEDGGSRARGTGGHMQAQPSMHRLDSMRSAAGHVVRMKSFSQGRDFLCCGLFQEGPMTGIPELDTRLQDESMTKKRFTLGLINLIAVCFVMGRWPEHLWLVYGIKCWLYIPTWYVRVVMKRKGYFFILEPCWIINCAIGIYLALSFFHVFSSGLRLWAFEAFFQSSLGFLGWSVLVSKNTMVFHSLTTISAILIHLVPTIVCLFLRWQRMLGVPMEETWPGVFPTVEEMESQSSVITLFLRGSVVYGAWWIIYVLWLMTIGLDCPQRGFPTIYHIYRRKNLALFKKIGGENMRCQAAAFMGIHLVLVTVSFLWAALCFNVYYVHLVWVLFLTILCVWRGADYYSNEIYARVFRDPLPEQLQELVQQLQQEDVTPKWSR